MIRPLLALALARAADAVVPKREATSLVDRARWRLALALIDATLRVEGRGPLVDALADLSEPPPSTLRSAEVNARGGTS